MVSDIPNLIDEYSDLILAIENDENEDPLWQRFYQIQMAIYLLTHYQPSIHLSHARDAYHKIYKTWDDLNNYLSNPKIPVNNIDNLFKTIHIDFLN